MYNLADPGTIKSILTRHDFNFSKALGQNFLINSAICPRMAQLCGASQAAGVIEIGPGIGVLTAELAKHAKKVVAIELDKRLMPVLKETLEGVDNVTVLQGDALTIDLKDIIDREFEGQKVAVCANLPYYITSPVIMHLLESRLPITSITVMVQKEAAVRLTATPGTREAGAVSLAVSYYSQPKVLFDVSSTSFMPRPSVDSCVIQLDVRDEPPVKTLNEVLMFRIIRAAFSQRRKTVLNAVASGLSLSKERLTQILTAVGIPPTERGERLTLDDFARLADELCKE
jgi:16S rRNA (adenine1518-N6/adenine1519-N6)-dimethyltransferase